MRKNTGKNINYQKHAYILYQINLLYRIIDQSFHEKAEFEKGERIDAKICFIKKIVLPLHRNREND